MYLDYYNLHSKPFQISTDPKFLWLGEQHKEALAVLKYGILDNKGFLLLTGDVGTGKTTLLNALIESLGADVLVALVTDPGLAKMDFFNFVADSFAIDKQFRSKGEFLIYLKNFLLELHRQNRQTLLIIDECQQLTQNLLEEVRLLSNIEKFNTKLINIFFVGQTEFNDIILRPRNRAIRQRITINYNISALTESETEKYIGFRLGVAGASDAIFTPGAIQEVFKFSNGYPRLINIICDQALLTGYVKEKKRVDEKIVAECAHELKIPYGISIRKSLATPEAADQQLHRPRSSQGRSTTDMAKFASRYNKPLIAALIAFAIIWMTLIVIFIFNQSRPQAVERAESGMAATDALNPGTPDATDASTPPSSTGAVRPPSAEAPNPPAEVPQSPGPPPVASKTEPSRAPDDTAALTPRVSLQTIWDKYGKQPAVRFGLNSNQLESDAYEALDLIARFWNENPETAIVLRGYTDSTGVRAYNLKLSEFRADMVKTYLVARGVEESNIKAFAMGPETPVPDASGTPVDEAQRKVVIEIIPPPE